MRQPSLQSNLNGFSYDISQYLNTPGTYNGGMGRATVKQSKNGVWLLSAVLYVGFTAGGAWGNGMGFYISGVASSPDFYQPFQADYNTGNPPLCIGAFTQGGGNFFYVYPNGTQGAGTYQINASLNEIRLRSKPTWAIDFSSAGYR